MRYMVDSTNVQDDPLGVQLVMYYCDGIYAVDPATVRARFPNAILVSCSAIGTNCGKVGDVEPGCMTIAQSIVWVQERRAAGEDPTLYCNELHTWLPLRLAFQAAGVPEPHYLVANYDGVAEVPAGTVGKQYENPTLTFGHFDRSVVADFWPGVDSEQGGLDMAIADDIFNAVVAMPPRTANGQPITQTDDELRQMVASMTWPQVAAQLGADGETFAYALTHPEARQTAIQLIQKLAAGEAIDMSELRGDVAAVKAEEDELKRVLIQAPSSPVGQDTLPTPPALTA
jgi:hypothetical protein